MFDDARTLADGTEITADLCIIGAGAAGITLAREFVGRPLRVILLESGGLEFDAATQSLAAGESAGFPYYDLQDVRLRYFGGTTNHWAGACRPLEPIDFQPRPWVPNSGWPFTREDLEPYYARAHAVCRLAALDYGANVWETEENPSLPLRPGPIRTALHQTNPVRFGEQYREVLRQARNVRALLHANVTNVQANSSGRRVERLQVATLDGTRFSVRARAYVLATGAIENARLLLASNGDHGPALGSAHDLVGRYFMEHLSVAGAFFLPSRADLRLGLYRGGGRHPTGAPDVVGHAFLVPSEAAVRREEILGCRAFLSPISLRRGESLRYASESVIAAESLARAIRDGTALGSLSEHVRRLVSDIDDVAVFAYRYLRHAGGTTSAYYITYHIENAPRPESRVELGSERDPLGVPRARLTWRFGDLELRTLRAMGNLLARGLGEARVGRVRILHEDAAVEHRPFTQGSKPPGWPARVRGAWHQMGTTRMHPDPRRGVVDPDCRVHDVSNLYVAGSSVFPTVGYINPTLTIVALALRLADHLNTTLSSAV